MKAAPQRSGGPAADTARLASKGSRTRQRLLDATAAEVARCGADGASVNTIADAAGIKPGSIYFHYPSKEMLIEAMVEEGLLRSIGLLEAALAALPPGTDAATRLVAAIHAHAEAVMSLRDYTVAILAPSRLGGASERCSRKLRGTYGSLWTQLITEAQDKSALPPGPSARLLRDLIFGALNAVGLGRNSPHAAADALVALLGLRADLAPAGQAAT